MNNCTQDFIKGATNEYRTRDYIVRLSGLSATVTVTVRS